MIIGVLHPRPGEKKPKGLQHLGIKSDTGRDCLPPGVHAIPLNLDVFPNFELVCYVFPHFGTDYSKPYTFKTFLKPQASHNKTENRDSDLLGHW